MRTSASPSRRRAKRLVIRGLVIMGGIEQELIMDPGRGSRLISSGRSSACYWPRCYWLRRPDCRSILSIVPLALVYAFFCLSAGMSRAARRSIGGMRLVATA